MTELYQDEKNHVTNKGLQQNLMTSLVRASEEETSGGLTEIEVYGNSKY